MVRMAEITDPGLRSPEQKALPLYGSISWQAGLREELAVEMSEKYRDLLGLLMK